MVTEEAVVLFRSVAEVHPWWQDGNAKQADHAEIFQQNTQGHSKSRQLYLLEMILHFESSLYFPYS